MLNNTNNGGTDLELMNQIGKGGDDDKIRAEIDRRWEERKAAELRTAPLHTEDEIDALFAMLAQGVINIDSGLTTIENGSRVHRAMSRIVELRARGMLHHGEPKLVQNGGDLVTVKPATAVEAGEPIPEERCTGCKMRADLCDVPNTIEDHPLGRMCFKCRDTEDLVGKITAMLLAAPSYQLNQTTIARKLGRKALSIGHALWVMQRRNITVRPISSSLERPSAITYRLSDSTINAAPARQFTK